MKWPFRRDSDDDLRFYTQDPKTQDPEWDEMPLCKDCGKPLELVSLSSRGVFYACVTCDAVSPLH